ncbi:hypothetical protein HYN73_00735 [Vibrio parahaemolyticus]|uniref:hypothetical protein n=1 Tax=Vibrio parahaemolyticus TaxID=670 RepID=UPI0004D9D9EB|nr:hypothetical protein [Vibrio parahaemolyticus]EGR1699941.1 hypothetical protein [Vibrio parahaemolyticus]MBM5189594.1 hypothetical protein [Vibrio parahaemolyticus]MBM5201927.1 hypothetical protein [Vibrio parahaemolyticus]MBM5206389.1 hypothetical protein [Vibrio parahaemolyticus]MBM5207742.1 hypothetical protein [Vibrio parahaemolyticus]
MKYAMLVLAAMLSFTSFTSYSHPGRTASDGCHYCRTNCAKWGVPENQRHCHFYSEPTEEEMLNSKVVKKYSDDETAFVTLLKNNTWTTFETKHDTAHVHQ